jgi:hypothetical protein
VRQKKRYVLLKSMPSDLPKDAKFLFQTEIGYVLKTDLKTAENLRCEALLISGCIKNVKHPKGLNRRTAMSNAG